MAVEQDFVIALAVEQHVPVGVERELRDLADDLLESGGGGLGVVLDRIGHLLGVADDQGLLRLYHDLFDLDARPEPERVQVGDGSFDRDLLREGIVSDGRHVQPVASLVGDGQRELSVEAGGHGRHDGRIPADGGGCITDGLRAVAVGDDAADDVGGLGRKGCDGEGKAHQEGRKGSYFHFAEALVAQR